MSFGVKIDLNREQQKAVDHTRGPLLVVAGAGTGKTRVIIERLAKLVESGVEKKHILALTFTEKAAQEMLDRAAERLEESYGVELNIHTFNAFGAKTLTEFAVEIGLSSNLHLIGDNGKVVLLREHLDELGLDYFAPISAPDRLLADIAGYFSHLKQQLVKPADYDAFAKAMPARSDEERLDRTRHTELAHAYETYQQITREQNIIDYDDQLYLLVELLEARPNVLMKLQDRYRYIMVDEFQDTNPMQSRLIDLLSGAQENVFVVGDDDQSIYGWRGATLANILDFTKRYPKAKEVTLIKNFRSTQEILDGAWRLIQHNNPDRLEALNNLNKKLVASRGKGLAPTLHKFSRLDAELNWVAEDLKNRIEAGANPGDIAILARSKRTVSRVDQMLSSSGIEHTVAGVTNDLYHHPAVILMLEALKCVSNPHDNTALYHVLGSRLFGCDPQLLAETSAKARSEHSSLETALAELSDKKINESLKLINQWRAQTSELTVRDVSYNILTGSGLKDALYATAQSSPESAQTVKALGQWFASLNDFEQVAGMPSTQSYIENLEVLRAEGETLADDSVNIDPALPVVMTIHKAKGLEWSVVYIVDCTERSFPSQRFGTSLEVPTSLAKNAAADDHINEERRLMYVGATRARDQLIVTHSDSHNGTTIRKPSRFIEELFGKTDGELSASEKLVGLDALGPSNIQLKSVSLPSRMQQNGNIVLTASQADDYLLCPLNFYYKHVLNVPEPPSSATVVGSLFHGLIQEINTAKRDGNDIPPLGPMLERLEREWPAVGYSSKTQRARGMKLGLASFKTLYERLLVEPVPIAVEESFGIRLPDSKLILNGRVDVVVPDGDGVQIRDYKTSTGVQTPDKAKAKTTSNNQLVMYALAWRLMHDEDPLSVSLDFVQTGQVGVVRKQAKTLDNMQLKLAGVAEDILAGKFPRGAKHDFCQHPI